MSDAWEEIQAIKNKRMNLREKLQKRKKEMQNILNSSISFDEKQPAEKAEKCATSSSEVDDALKTDSVVEDNLLSYLSDVAIQLPVNHDQIAQTISQNLSKKVTLEVISNLLQKFAAQNLISINETKKENTVIFQLVSVEHAKLLAMTNEHKSRKRKIKDVVEPVQELLDDSKEKEDKRSKKPPNDNDIMSLLSMPSIKEQESKKVGEEIFDLLSKSTAKERSMAEKFKSQGGAQVKEFCPHGTKAECAKVTGNQTCLKLHFKKILQKHTDEVLGDCSFLNTCFHMDTCKYVHYEVDGEINSKKDAGQEDISMLPVRESATTLFPAQWIQCDLRYLDITLLGKFAVIMADPPWDIHMELPYGTMSDDEMRQLGIPLLQDEGLIFLWVTGRAMELGRDCLKLWGYERVDEIIWVKTNQLQRIIRTGRTGHWLNHGKEHCLVGMKGNPPNLNRGLDSDVIVAEVRATSHKPDEIYGIIERLSPGTRKIELFGRPHNVQPNWITLGNQLNGVKLVDPPLKKSFYERYPDGNCMGPQKSK
ncbi:N6-adenosine-methyltransferase subunit METTL3 [Neocloeon triangulifer]|uniref:N6-adenosine-methyltransferase subunit METTL3 n=1 Tax=Neocloeon triangulifer TaxID=2078957 RepID=UPI00286FA390|nr:N6-adenosine-methyltransferase subunit METTL3 [Neocloeon triangulifer]